MTTPPANLPEGETTTPDEDFEILDASNVSLCSVSAETYLSLPEELLGLSTVNDVENAIQRCKNMILTKTEDTEERKWLVRRLIELRIRLENLREVHDQNAIETNINENKKVILGHHFTLQSFPKSPLHYYCDRCSGVIWNVLHSWYLCSECNYKCHVKCLDQVCRVCAHVLVTEKPTYIYDICPQAENGLANQNYRCAECLAHTSISYNSVEPRLCDYTGKYYCSTCHWNSTSVIPARVILNWDFEERVVCRSSKQILNLMSKLPILKLEELNPVLFACIEELGVVKELRQQLMQIKKYLTSCKSALEEQLLWQSNDKVHFLENEDTYSLQDLFELRTGELVKYLNKLRDCFIRHIKVDCEANM
ncbi:hypothetical protein RUM44_010072 [Polyplax serrata]|uniref:Phorbol-ester/DAG-type domain-containing protein n=1 Tax=Polyplax serrata TaxID=468196 RepID=A0ABR1AUJ1_POLSC